MIKRSIRWALLVAVVSAVLAVILGVLALTGSDENEAESAQAEPIEGTYAFESTDILLDTPFAGRTELLITGGRLAIGADGHVFWSLQMHSRADASRTGRLSCEGSFDAARHTVAPSPRYGYSDFAPDLANQDIQRSIYQQFCAAVGINGPDDGPWQVAQNGTTVQMKGRGGVLSWRRE